MKLHYESIYKGIQTNPYYMYPDMLTDAPLEGDINETRLKRFTREVRAWVRQDRDCVIVITGVEGGGKTMCELAAGLEIDDNFSLKRNMMMNPSAFDFYRKLMSELPKYSVMCFDEGMKAFYKRGWQDKTRQALNTMFSICRAKNKVFIICIPNFFDLDVYYRHHRVKYWIHVFERGYAAVFEQRWHPFSPKDPWNVEYNSKRLEELEQRMKHRELSVTRKDKLLSTLKGFKCSITWNKVNPVLWREYKRMKDSVTDEFIQGASDKEAATPQDKKTKATTKLEMLNDVVRNSVIALATKGLNASQIAQVTQNDIKSVKSIMRKEGIIRAKPFRQKVIYD